MKYIVLVDDNFHYMDDTESVNEGEFDTAEAAIACAKTVVDKCLAGLYSQLSKQQPAGKTLAADELYRHYNSFGDSPFVIAEDKTVKFSGWSYAKERCEEMTKA